MRYFVYLDPALPALPYILAEVVREATDDGRFRDSSAASSLAGKRCTIVTREELMVTVAGRTALEDWDTFDDDLFDADSRRMNANLDRGEVTHPIRHLSLVPDVQTPRESS